MAITVKKAKLTSTTANKSNVEVDYVQVKCDSSYVTGGYSLDIKQYSAIDGYVWFVTNFGDSIGGAYDATTKKLIITRGGSEVPSGTDLSAVDGILVITKVPGINTPTLTPTTGVQDETGGNYLKKNADDTVVSGATITIASGAGLKVEGNIIKPTATEITADGQDVYGVSDLKVTASTPATITEFTQSTVLDGQEITVTFETTKSMNETGNMVLTGCPTTLKENDTVTFKYNSSASKWYVVRWNTADGTVNLTSTGTLTAGTGSTTTISGNIIEPTKTEITADSQDVYGVNSVKLTASTPASVGTLTQGTTTNSQRIKVSWETAKTMNNSGNIVLAGSVDFAGQSGDYIVLEFSTSDSKWHEIERHLTV